jgi:hypothetical protein
VFIQPVALLFELGGTSVYSSCFIEMIKSDTGYTKVAFVCLVS